MKTVLITGSSEGGIGAALAKAFQKRSLRVFATARNPSKMASLSSLENVVLLRLDPTSQESVQAAVEQVRKDTGGKLDYLVNNAGQTLMAPTLDFDIETAKRMYEINLWGALRVTQAFAPLVIAAKGTMVYTCSLSTACRTPWLGTSNYLLLPYLHLLVIRIILVLSFISSQRHYLSLSLHRLSRPFAPPFSLTISSRRICRLKSSFDPNIRDPPSRTRSVRRQGSQRHYRRGGHAHARLTQGEFSAAAWLNLYLNRGDNRGTRER